MAKMTNKELLEKFKEDYPSDNGDVFITMYSDIKIAIIDCDLICVSSLEQFAEDRFNEDYDDIPYAFVNWENVIRDYSMDWTEWTYEEIINALTDEEQDVEIDN